MAVFFFYPSKLYILLYTRISAILYYIIASQFANLFLIIKLFLFRHSPSNAKMRRKDIFLFIPLQFLSASFFLCSPLISFSIHYCYTHIKYKREKKKVEKTADFNMQMQLNFIDEFTTQSRAF